MALNKKWGAKIVTLDEFASLRPKLGKIVATSGGYDPIHPGHISLIIESRKFGNTVVVIVNSDDFLVAKKGKPFQNLATRCLIVSGIKEVDYVVPAVTETDMSVNEALKVIKPHVYTKGGDTVDPSTIREWEVCKKNGTKVVFEVGEGKEWSSSWFTKDWDKTIHTRAINKTKHKLKNKVNKYLTS